MLSGQSLKEIKEISKNYDNQHFSKIHMTFHRPRFIRKHDQVSM